MSDHRVEDQSSSSDRGRRARSAARAADPAVSWVAVAALTNIALAPAGGRGRGTSVCDEFAAIRRRLQAMNKIGEVFEEFDSDSAAMIVLEGDEPLGEDAHQYYDELVKKLDARHQARRAHPGLLG